MCSSSQAALLEKGDVDTTTSLPDAYPLRSSKVVLRHRPTVLA